MVPTVAPSNSFQFHRAPLNVPHVTVTCGKPSLQDPYCFTVPFEMSSISLYTGLSVADEREIRNAIAVLNQNFGEKSTLRFIEMIFKLGTVRVSKLLRAADTNTTHTVSSGRRNFMEHLLDRDWAMRPIANEMIEFSFISQETGNAMFETSMASTSFGASTDPKGAMSDVRMRPGPVMACNCYRKAPYKTERGVREHLVLKHGLSPLEAEAQANLTFHESKRGSIQPQNESNEEQTPTAAGIYGPMNDGSQSQGVEWEAFFADPVMALDTLLGVQETLTG
ncbi:hypothetical protein BDV97DRAFT_360624 [Delphinella strobiligena]|nr:hypothetical protein BDV97DRAFT_360624 [Delphinella strobiligena]